MSLSLRVSAVLAGLFIAQLVVGGVLRAGFHNGSAATVELFVFGVAYLVFAMGAIVRARHGWLRFVRGASPRSTGESGP